MQSTPLRHKEPLLSRIVEVFITALLLGFTSFGGPIAHLGYFRTTYVTKKKWLDERAYADLVALCQFLPGPASSQVGMGIGTMRAGIWGGIAAWLGFTLPSAIALILFALFIKDSAWADAGWLQGLKIVAVAIVAHAVISMGQKLANEKKTATIAIIAATFTLLFQTPFTQISVIALAGLVGFLIFQDHDAVKTTHHTGIESKSKLSLITLVLFFMILLGLPVISRMTGLFEIKLFDSFFRSGALVFGGGHVVMPLLEFEVVPSGWVTQAEFMAGYGATQAIPGPVFAFSSFLGMVAGGLGGALIALVAIFMPAFLLVVGVLPFWDQLRGNKNVKAALVSINAAVVGILLAALYNPLWTNAIYQVQDFVLAMILYGLLAFWKLPSWLVVIAGMIGGTVIGVLF